MRELKLFFTVHIGVAHGTGSDHTLFPLASEPLFEKDRRILLDLDILEIMLHLIASGTTVAVNTAMCTASVNIHSVIRGKDPFSFNKVHINLKNRLSAIDHAKLGRIAMNRIALQLIVIPRNIDRNVALCR